MGENSHTQAFDAAATVSTIGGVGRPINALSCQPASKEPAARCVGVGIGKQFGHRGRQAEAEQRGPVVGLRGPTGARSRKRTRAEFASGHWSRLSPVTALQLSTEARGRQGLQFEEPRLLQSQRIQTPDTQPCVACK